MPWLCGGPSMENLPDKVYDLIVDHFTKYIGVGGTPMPSTEEQLAWFNQIFPEATWYIDQKTNRIWPKFKSKEHETMFMLKWS